MLQPLPTQDPIAHVAPAYSWFTWRRMGRVIGEQLLMLADFLPTPEQREQATVLADAYTWEIVTLRDQMRLLRLFEELKQPMAPQPTLRRELVSHLTRLMRQYGTPPIMGNPFIEVVPEWELMRLDPGLWFVGDVDDQPFSAILVPERPCEMLRLTHQVRVSDEVLATGVRLRPDEMDEREMALWDWLVARAAHVGDDLPAPTMHCDSVPFDYTWPGLAR